MRYPRGWAEPDRGERYPGGRGSLAGEVWECATLEVGRSLSSLRKGGK